MVKEMACNAEITEKTKKYSMLSWCVQNKTNPVPFEKGERIYLYDAEGNKWWDLCSSSVYVNVGHQHPKVVQAIKDQADTLTFAGPKASNSTKAECAKKIIELLPDKFGRVFFTNGGADANENAIKFARNYTGRYKIFSRYTSYHGATSGAISLTGDPRRWATEPYNMTGIMKFPSPYCYQCPYKHDPADCNLACLDYFEQTLIYENPYSVAAVLIETFTGTNGILPAPEGYLQKLRNICDKYGILLIFDEVMAGFGRSGYFFSFEHEGVLPDIITASKGLTSGYVPMGAVVLSNDVAAFFDDKMIQQGLTTYGHTLGAAAASACIDVYKDEGLLENSKVMGEYAMERLNELKDKYNCVGDIRGRGLFMGIELVKDKSTHEPLCPFNGGPSPVDIFSKHVVKNKFFMMIHWNVVMFCPPLVINKEEIDHCIDVFEEGFKLLDAELAK
ncbi:MAG: aminotransferase class III-fold pyridoxal phosphate-dependent enzyme [Bacillota bacterium]|jgi:taurine--2-oxoglutarate transaminase